MALAEERSASKVGRVIGVAAFTAVNLIAAQFVVVRIASSVTEGEGGPVTQEIWVPVMYLIWAQVGLVGLLLLLHGRTRVAGVGIVAGTIATVALVFAFFILVVAPAIA